MDNSKQNQTTVYPKLPQEPADSDSEIRIECEGEDDDDCPSRPSADSHAQAHAQGSSSEPALAALTTEQRQTLSRRIGDAQRTVQCYRGDLVELTRTPAQAAEGSAQRSMHSAPTRILVNGAGIDGQVDAAWERELSPKTGRSAAAPALSHSSAALAARARRQRFVTYAGLGGALLAACFYGGQWIGGSLVAHSAERTPGAVRAMHKPRMARNQPPPPVEAKDAAAATAGATAAPAALPSEPAPAAAIPPAAESAAQASASPQAAADVPDDQLPVVTTVIHERVLDSAPPAHRAHHRIHAQARKRLGGSRPPAPQPGQKPESESEATLEQLMDSVPTEQLNLPGMTSMDSLGHSDEPHAPPPSAPKP